MEADGRLHIQGTENGLALSADGRAMLVVLCLADHHPFELGLQKTIKSQAPHHISIHTVRERAGGATRDRIRQRTHHGGQHRPTKPHSKALALVGDDIYSHILQALLHLSLSNVLLHRWNRRDCVLESMVSLVQCHNTRMGADTCKHPPTCIA